MTDIFLCDGIRTPVGRYGGSLAAVRPDDLAALVIRQIIERSGIDPATVEDVYFGSSNQAGEDNRNVARMAALLAGLPDTVPGCTVNRLCASGLEAINIAARMIETGHGDVFIAGGTESMSRAPFVMAKSETAFARAAEIYDTTLGWRFTNPSLAAQYHPYSMGETAENVARKFGVSREVQDAFAVSSQSKWGAAKASCRFDSEIVTVEIPQRKGDPVIVDTDEHPRPDATLEKPLDFNASGDIRNYLDNDGNGVPTLGDDVLFEMCFTNTGATTLTNLGIDDPFSTIGCLELDPASVKRSSESPH